MTNSLSIVLECEELSPKFTEHSGSMNCSTALQLHNIFQVFIITNYTTVHNIRMSIGSNLTTGLRQW